MLQTGYVFLFVVLLCAQFASSFKRMSLPSVAVSCGKGRLEFYELNALKRMKAGSDAPIREPGKNIPEEVANKQCIYDMILVERVSMPDTTGSIHFITLFQFS